MANNRDKALAGSGFHRSSSDPDKWLNSTNGHWVKQHEGGSLTFSTSRHNDYGAGMSKKDFGERLKK